MNPSIDKQLLKLLDKIDRPGTFCTRGELPSMLPGLEVSGLGPIGLPLEKGQATALKKLARQAPYGKGTQTVVDTKVRRVWEIDAEQVTFANPAWADIVKGAVDTIQSELGLLKQKLQAHLYKLLVYETGSFFLPHRDGEKLDRMVATLVIALPSHHEGGDLIVRHEGREVVIDFGPKSRFHTQFAAFYADCEHEVRPVTSGFRLALVYNLTLAQGKGGIAAPTSGEHIAAATALLRKWVAAEWEDQGRSGEIVPPKMAVLLDYKYSQAGLTRDTLKGIDRVEADVLFDAARAAGCDASLALVTYWESGSAEPSGGYDYGRHDRYGWGGDDDSDDDDDGDYIMQEVYDHSLKAEYFTDPEGLPLAFGRIPFDEEEIVSKAPLNEGDPDEQDFEGYTGNAGMTLERWYHRAAVVIWPETARFDVLCGAGVEAAVGGLAQMVRQWKKTGKKESESLKPACLEFASRIIARWPAPGSYGYHHTQSTVWENYEDDYDEDMTNWSESEIALDTPMSVLESSARPGARNIAPGQSLIILLNALGDGPLVAAWIRGVLARDPSVTPGAALGHCCKRHGWLVFRTELEEVFEATTHDTLERHAALLGDFALRKDRNAERIALGASLAGRLMAVVEAWSPHTAQKDWRARKVALPRLLSSLTQSFLALERPDLVARLAAYVLARPKEFDLTAARVPMWLELESWLKSNVKTHVPPMAQWIDATIDALETRAAQPPLEPADYRRDSATGCTCPDCKVLSAFLDDPNQATFRFPLAQARRGHLHEVVKKRMLDTTHVTERVGRPFTLVFRKTKDSYKRALKAHQLDLEHLAKMRSIQKWHNGLKGERPTTKATKPKAVAKAKPQAKTKTVPKPKPKAKVKKG